jgi:hypothetical protein
MGGCIALARIVDLSIVGSVEQDAAGKSLSRAIGGIAMVVPCKHRFLPAAVGMRQPVSAIR